MQADLSARVVSLVAHADSCNVARARARRTPETGIPSALATLRRDSPWLLNLISASALDGLPLRLTWLQGTKLLQAVDQMF